MDDFVDVKCQGVNFKFWWNYLEMISVLLMFTRSLRDGLWNLYLYAFKCMLPFFMRYDHINYSRWGTIYLADMYNLPDEILNEFQRGNFVVKRTSAKFNQVSPDQSQEWLNAVGKVGGGIVGITKTTSALSRWALSYNQRSDITMKTREMFHVNVDDTLVHKESSRSRKAQDASIEQKILNEIQRLNIFLAEDNEYVLKNAATKDLVTDTIADSLLNAEKYGKLQLEKFVNERLVEKTVDIRDTMKKNKAQTFSSLYDIETIKTTGKSDIIKVDRNVLKRLITAYEARRDVNLEEILMHELMPVPVAIAETNGALRSGNKALLAEALIDEIICPETISILDKGKSCLLIDGQALVQAIGKPAEATTFGDLADVYVKSVLKKGDSFGRVDILFDRYRDLSIKA